MTLSGRTMRMPGASPGTMIMLCCECLGASGSVLPMVMKTWQRGSPAPEIHHLWPLITYSSPWRSMRVQMLVASEEATSGRSEEHTSELQSPCNLVCRLLLEKKKTMWRAGVSSVMSPQSADHTARLAVIFPCHIRFVAHGAETESARQRLAFD